MGIYLNPSNIGFKRALNSKIYVDKTGLLEYTNSVLETEQCCTCVSRPRRFGKSMAAEMLVAYYSKGCDSKDMFEGLEISKSPDFQEHLNKYSVIHVDMNEFRLQVSKLSDIVQYLQNFIIKELKEEFPNCIDSSVNDLPMALMQVYRVYGEQFIIVIDEWDTIFREDKTATEVQKDYINLLRGLFKNASSKAFLQLAYLTGILPIKKYGTESALNNFREFTMLDPGVLTEYIGFTEDEVHKLCQKYDMDFQQAKQWYDGYVFDDVHIYNPNSIVNAMLDRKFKNYWSKTETYSSLRHYISTNFEGLKDSIVQMLANERCEIDISSFENDMTSFSRKDDILTVLVHLGYLAYDEDNSESYIPNEEVRSSFINAINSSDWEDIIQLIKQSKQLLNATLAMNEEAVAEMIDIVHSNSTSILQYNNENSLACVVTLAYYQARAEYSIVRELPTGKGFADIVFIPKRGVSKPAIIVELKWNKSVVGAINQIKEKRYPDSLIDYQDNLLLVGINYNKDTKKHECRIEKLNSDKITTSEPHKISAF